MIQFRKGGKMKKTLKVMAYTVLAIIILVDILVTVYLLNFNKYNVSQLGEYSTLIMKEEVGDFNENDLLIVKKNDNSEIKVGDYIFFYDISSKENLISYGKVNNTTEVNEEQSTFTTSNNVSISSDSVIGKGETAMSFANIGLLLFVLSSQWGFLFLVIFPILILFLYQTYTFIFELKKVKE